MPSGRPYTENEALRGPVWWGVSYGGGGPAEDTPAPDALM